MPGHSPCWKLFILMPDRKTVECRICTLQMSYSGNSTSNLLRHLKAKHPRENRLEVENKKCYRRKEEASISDIGINQTHASTSQSLERTGKYRPDSIRKKQLDDELVDLIITDVQPLSIVEQKGFMKFVHLLDPKYEIVSRKRLKQQLLPERYSKMKKVVTDELRQVQYISISTDCWTSLPNEAYTTFTAHFLTFNWELKTRVLMTCSQGKRHTSENIAKELLRTFHKFSIIGKVTTIVTDNTTNIKNAVEITKIRHLPCFAHTLNLTVRESIEADQNISSIVKKVKDIVTYFHSSPAAMNSLRELHTSKGGIFRTLKQNVDTCWKSTFNMLRSYLVQHEDVTNVLSLFGKMKLSLEESDVSEGQEAVDALEPFYEATTELSSEKSTLASKIIPLVTSLQKITARGTSTLSMALHSSLNQRFAGVEGKTCLRLATLLDPRFKKAAFSTPESANSAVDKLTELAKLIHLPGEQQKDVDDDDDDVVEIAPPPAKKPSLLWSDFDEETTQLQRAAAKQISAADMEVRYYLESKGIRRNKDPLAWWKEHARAMPRLETIAKDVLAVPATSVPCERIFSESAEFPASMRRAQLEKNNIDMIMFLNKNV